MSLINEALKRAQKVQPPAATEPVSGPPFRAAEPMPPTRTSLSVAVLLALAGVAMLASFLVWRVSHHDVLARSEPVVTETKPAAPEVAVAPAAKPEPLKPETAGSPMPAPSVSTSPPPVAAEADQPTPLSNAPVVVQAPPKPVLPRLQGIIYNPSRPSAVLDGHPLFVGEHLGPYRLVAISHDSATIVGAGATNLLTLDP